MNAGTGYVSGSAAPSTGGVSGQSKDKAGYWSLSKCKRAYLDYLGNKTNEIEEQKDARRYYHGAQWTEEQLKVLKKRRQPPSTKNRIARKIDGTIGLIERLRQDPKAFPRTPKQEEGAELATAVLRYVLDEQEWKAKSPECARDGAVDGIGGIEIELEQGDHGDPEVGFDIVEPDSFFYDPRSYRADFSDSRYMGMGKWTDVDIVKDMFPDAEDIGGQDGSDLTSNPDREQKWFSSDGSKKLVRLVDIWYQHNGGWCWAIFTGSQILMEGRSYLVDEKNMETCKYIMFSCNVDHDGDRYGFVRNMKSSQDSFNFKHSKLNHILASRRLMLSQGSVQDVEKARTEWARDDGVVLVNGNVNDGIKADDRSFDFAGWAKLLEEDKQELDNYGPNQALIGDIQNQSGRAIQLLQQAGMAELGPYILGYRGWKVRVYRALFCAVQKYWTAERYIRVTDDEGLAQFIQINGVGVDPRTGHPTMVNALGSLDVDIIMEEGPDTINAQQDVYETLSNVLPTVGPMLSPPLASAAVEILIDNSALPATSKKKFREASQAAAQMPPPPNPEIEKTKIQLEAKQIENASQLEFESQKAAAEMEMDRQRSAQEFAAKQDQAAIDMETEMAKAREAAALKRQEADDAYRLKLMELDAELATEQQRMAFEFALKQEEAAMTDRRESEKSAAEANGQEAERVSKKETNDGLMKVVQELANASRVTKVAKKVGNGEWRVEAVG